MIRKKCPVIVLSFIVMWNAAANATTENKEILTMDGKQILITRIGDSSRTPKIDGVLDDMLWQETQPTEGLHQVQPDEFAPATERTRFWIAYDKDNLYVAVQLFDKKPDLIVAMQLIQGKEFESDDQLHISLDPFNQNRDGYFFQVNPNGIRNEALITNTDSGFNGDWSTIWQAASEINEQGWATEIVIPFKSISFDPEIDTWGFNLGRVIRRKGEVLAWSSLGDDVWEMGPTVMGDIKPITDIDQGLGLDIQVSGVITHTKDHLLNQSDSEAEPSLDIFYKPNPALSIVGTINTDFSATEVDERTVNLGRFNIMLPEKRDFFLQDANQFTFADIDGDNGQPFFSRSIGLDDNNRPVSLDGGLKLSGRFDSYNLGLLAIRQQASGLQENDADLFVFRGTKDILKESSVGMIYTHGDPKSDQKNEVFGFDFNYNNSNAFGNSLVQAALWYQESEDGTDIKDNRAYGFTLAYPNSRYYLNWEYKTIERNFNPAMGFVNRPDIHQNWFEAYFTHFFSGGWIKSFEPGFNYWHINNTSGERQTERFRIIPVYLESISGDSLRFRYTKYFENVDENFNIVSNLVIPAGGYSYERTNLRIMSSIARPFYAIAEVSNGNYYDGDRFDQEYELGWRPWNPWLLTLEYDVKKLDLPSGSFTTRISQIGSELAITSYWSWTLLTQFDNVSSQLAIQSRLRWLPQAGRELYFVINTGKQRLEDDSYQSLYDNYTLKASYTFRF